MKVVAKGQRLRILYVENGIGYGGAVVCLRHLVRNLDLARFEPIVVTGRGDDAYRAFASDAAWHHVPDRRFDATAARRTLAAARWPDWIPGLRTLLGQLVARLDDFLNTLPFLLGLIRIALRYRPAIIHANNEPLCNRAALLAGKLLRIPVVCHVRGDLAGSRSMYRLFRLPDHVVCVSQWVSDSVGRLGIRKEKRSRVYDGIALDEIDADADGREFRRANGIPPEAFAVGLIGLLIPWKGQQLFLEAARRLLDAIPEAHFVVIGGAPDEFRGYERELREEAARPEYRGKVTFSGHVTDVSAAYNGLDVVVSASTEPEPFGMVIVEAQAMGRPLVAADHGGAVETVEDGRTGLLFKAGSSSALAEAILRLRKDPGLARRLGTQARERALTTFSVAEHVRRVEAIYDRVLTERASSSSRLPSSA
jgi:glycosyltransferase involved in cell wall biosynthesis